MNDPTEKHKFKPAPPKILAMAADQFDRLLADTRREALEEACNANCPMCKQGRKAVKNPQNGIYQHPIPGSEFSSWCGSADIYTLMEQPK